MRYTELVPLELFILTLIQLQGLYDEHQSSMDELGGFEPTDATGFIQIESIRIKK
jgi:Arginosuccinate synthase